VRPSGRYGPGSGWPVAPANPPHPPHTPPPHPSAPRCGGIGVSRYGYGRATVPYGGLPPPTVPGPGHPAPAPGPPAPGELAPGGRGGVPWSQGRRPPSIGTYPTSLLYPSYTSLGIYPSYKIYPLCPIQLYLSRSKTYSRFSSIAEPPYPLESDTRDIGHKRQVKGKSVWFRAMGVHSPMSHLPNSLLHDSTSIR
jgi:hypothetical protein